jgi:hypothetical protein
MFRAPGPLENDAALDQMIKAKQAEYRTDADEAQPLIAQQRAADRDARLAGYKSPLRRLIERLLPSKGRPDN